MISRSSAAYKIARWSYQPIKQAGALATEFRSTAARRTVIADYLSRSGFKGLQIGSGSHYRKDWLNSDMAGAPDIDIGLDITQPLPFPDQSMDAVYGSEVIEHIDRGSVPAFLGEAFRVLRTGGHLRLTTPDLAQVCRIYLGTGQFTAADMATAWQDPECTPQVFINAMFRNWGHQWLWDFESFKDALALAGFARIYRAEVNQSDSEFQQLKNLETRYGVSPPPQCWALSMIVEAVK